MRRNVITARAAAVAAALLLAATGCGSGAAKPSAAPTATGAAGPSPGVDAPCLAGDPALAKDVSHFPGGYDHPVEAYTTGSGPVGVILAHQKDGDLCQWSTIWPDFTARGYTVMAITLGSEIDVDVAKAAARLRARGVRKIVLVGASMGGTACLAAAGEVTPPVQAVVSLSGPARYSTADGFAAVKTFHVPVAFFAGEQDEEFATDARTLYDATAEPDKTLHIFKADSGHGVDLWPEAEAEVFAFIAKYTR